MSPSIIHVQVAIIGAGPAGATCAAALASRGFDVCVLEARVKRPRPKVCGEYLSPIALRSLAPYLDKSVLIDAGARLVNKLEVYAQGQRIVEWCLPEQSLSLSRHTLDERLRQVARSCGAVIRQPAVVRHVRYADDGVSLTWDGGVVRAQCAIHADGLGRLDPAGPVHVRNDVIAAKCHVTQDIAKSNVVQLHGFRIDSGRGYFGLVEVEDHRATVAMILAKTVIRQFGGDMNRVLQTVMDRTGQQRWSSSHRISPWSSCALISSHYVRPGHWRSFRIGNAAGAVEPIVGEGIALAIWSGDWLGRHLNPDTPQNVRLHLNRAYRRRLGIRRVVTLGLAWWLRRPSALRRARPILSRWPGPVLRPIYHISGKSEFGKSEATPMKSGQAPLRREGHCDASDPLSCESRRQTPRK